MKKMNGTGFCELGKKAVQKRNQSQNESLCGSTLQQNELLNQNSDAKLRARQKERLAKRNSTESSLPIEHRSGTESLSQLPPPSAQAESHLTASIPIEEKFSAIDFGDHGPTAEGPNNKIDSYLKLGDDITAESNAFLKLPVISVGQHIAEVPLSNEHLEGTSTMNSLSDNLFPVIGLCAPNVNQMMPVERKFSRSCQR
ncbi:protein CHROMATIN REMODELING 4-like [Forsythia ovata]|uniref:Protein CHROMATIN REMODELING 4-like n=1 Tax=Forsythia ovata TaxID=205694 RepID=A0ABD1QGM8_9LAMI